MVISERDVVAVRRPASDERGDMTHGEIMFQSSQRRVSER